MRNRFLLLLLRQRRVLPWFMLAALVPCAAALPLAHGDATRNSTLDGATAPQTPATLEGALRALVDQADVVFTGEVSSIHRTPASVEIRWQVEDAVRGAAAGQVYVLREWAGLWVGNENRYVAGERALLLLHAPSPAGYASPVGGAEGVIALRGDTGSGTLDLRLLQQQVQVTDAARLRPVLALRAAGGSIALSDTLQRDYAARQPRSTLAMPTRAHSAALVRVQPGSDGSSTAIMMGSQSESGNGIVPAADPNSCMDAGVVVGMLKAWQRGAVK